MKLKTLMLGAAASFAYLPIAAVEGYVLRQPGTAMVFAQRPPASGTTAD